ncbi:flavin monoamine oxidase family protein [Pseudomonas sp. NPDC089392]|uniref:flavin monoamine oxidase family protein n=1 Tax=Pseudomonas sp. NPDC089392 TaxID=3364459 RepID=UPI00382983ED
MTSADPTQHTIAIVGGGLAGLHAAWQLQQRGVAFELFEARSRWGGRILSTPESGIDLGPTWFWPAFQPRMSKLLEMLQLPSFAQYTEGTSLVEHWNGQIARYDGPLMADTSLRIAGGCARLIQRLVDHLPSERLHLNAAVESISIGAEGISITAPAASTLPYRQVWLAIPPRLIPAIHFAPALAPATVNALKAIPTWMAAHAKYVALYDKPFWREQRLNGDAFSHVGPLAEIHDASQSGHAALFGFFRIPHGERASCGEQALKAACRAQLARLFGPQALDPMQDYLQDWAQEPHTATTRDHANGHEHAIASLANVFPTPWQACLRLIGSEAGSDQAGYMEGALHDIDALLDSA